jgi:hypothetical protein
MKRAAKCIIFSLIWWAFLPAFGHTPKGDGPGINGPDVPGLIQIDSARDELRAPGLLVTPLNNEEHDVDIDSLFLLANNLYQQGEYEQALGTYHAIILAGFESADLYYNMGNAAYRSNSIGHAILYYEKALKLDPAQEDAIHNLEFVSRYRLDTFEGVPSFFLGAWVKGFVQLFTEKTWSILAMIFFIVILSGLLIYLFSRRMAVKKSGFVSGLASVLLFAITFSSALSRHRDIVHPDDGIILAPSVVVRSSPSESGTELFVLHEGTKIEVNEKVAGWQNIKVIDGREGWIMTGDFATI